MKAGDVQNGLRQLQRALSSLLESDAQSVLEQAAAYVRTSSQLHAQRARQTHSSRKVEPWGYVIDPARPLRFRPTPTDQGMQVQVDLYGTVLWKGDEDTPVQQRIHMRVWAADEDACYREDWDSAKVRDVLSDATRSHRGRVMLRMHFDLADSDAPGPKHHLQIGGRAETDEVSWYPEALKLPRLAYPPMDLILVAQLVAANFFTRDYSRLRRDPAWCAGLAKSERALLGHYYDTCRTLVQHEDNVLHSLWNTDLFR